MIDIAVAALAAGVAASTSLVWHWIFKPAKHYDEAERQVLEDRIEQLEKAAKKAKKQPTPAAGPFRTMPVGDPAESPLSEAACSTVVTQIYPWDKDLACPLCNAGNRYLTRADKTKGLNTDTHEACSGCNVHPTPHLHVECWSCGFYYAVKAALETEAEAAAET